MNRIRVLVADDHDLIRQGVRTTLSSEPNIHVVGEAATGIEAVKQTEKLNPDVVILDLAMPGLDGIEATRQIRAVKPNTQLLILSMHDSESLVRKALNAGACGYVLKSDLARKLRVALRAVCSGRRYLSRELSEKLAVQYLQEPEPQGEASASSLTNRELEVVHLLSLGKSSKEISKILQISVRTVETHRANVMRKLNVHSVTELLRTISTNKLNSVQTE